MTSRKCNKAPDAERLLLETEQYEEKRDFKNAFKCLLSAAQLGDAGSQLNLGNFYASGKGVRKNPAKAAHWYKRPIRADTVLPRTIWRLTAETRATSGPP